MFLVKIYCILCISMWMNVAWSREGQGNQIFFYRGLKIFVSQLKWMLETKFSPQQKLEKNNLWKDFLGKIKVLLSLKLIKCSHNLMLQRSQFIYVTYIIASSNTWSIIHISTFFFYSDNPSLVLQNMYMYMDCLQF